MIPRYRENWPCIVPIRVVKLIVIIAFLSKIVDHVAQVIEKSGTPSCVGFRSDVVSHRIRDGELMRRLFDTTRVSRRMKNDLARALNSLNGAGVQHVAQ